jgi:hypothetical protein
MPRRASPSSEANKALADAVGCDGYVLTAGEPEPSFDLCPDCEASDARSLWEQAVTSKRR